MGWGIRRHRAGALAVAVSVAATTLALSVPSSIAGPARPETQTQVIVRSDAGAAGAAAAVRDVGGRVTRQLGLIDGVSATIPGPLLPQLIAGPGLTVTPDLPVHVQGEVAAAPPVHSVFRDVVGATALNAAGNWGDGVTVAVIDTGVAAVADLAGRVVAVRDDVRNTTASCVNLSGEAGCDDSYGHGTFMAGIIAGDGRSSAGRHAGVAPAARILSVKVAGRDGASDVSTVLGALQWVVSFKDRYGIRVLNLSLGTDSRQSYRSDPLNYAVERAWAAGITVVVAASNRGPAAGTISKPGDDPFVITVGAIDDRGTASLADDHLPDFTSRGPTAADGLAKPDVVAPGAHIVAPGAPGSAIATNFPSSVGGGYQVGNGTSMATAVVSGAAALLVKANPTITPDRLKFALMATAKTGPVVEPAATGKGVIDAVAARSAPAGTANKGLTRSHGLGSLDASRGTLRVRTTDAPITLLNGALTAQLLLWDPIGYVTGQWSSSTWYTSRFYLSTWRTVTWEGSKWHGSTWEGSKWHGGADSTTSYGKKWQGSDWYGAWD